MDKQTRRRGGSAVPVLLQELTFELGRFSQGFGRRHRLHSTDVDALGHLHQAESHGAPLTPSALAASLDLSAPATSALLHRLESTGHVERHPDPEDGRRHYITLHDSARELAGSYFGPLAASLETSLEGMDPEEVEVVERWLRRAVEATRDAVGRLTPPA